MHEQTEATTVEKSEDSMETVGSILSSESWVNSLEGSNNTVALAIPSEVWRYSEVQHSIHVHCKCGKSEEVL